jgi:RNA polymerase sigma factor (sigma-70 family)
MQERNHQFQELMQRVQAGSDDAAQELLRTYGRHIIRVVRRHLDRRLRQKFDSTDFAQDVWASFFANCDRHERFEHPGQLAGYLAIMARNKVADEYRSRLQSHKHGITREQPLEARDSDAPHPHLVDRNPSPSQVLIADERIARIVESQPERYRQIVYLRGQGLSNHEIAALLKVNERTVRRVVDKLCEEGLS